MGGLGLGMGGGGGYSPWEKPGTPTTGAVGSQAGYFPSMGGGGAAGSSRAGMSGLGIGGGGPGSPGLQLFPASSPGGGPRAPPPPPKRSFSENVGSGGDMGGQQTVGFGAARSSRLGGGSAISRKSSMLGVGGDKSGKDD